MYGSGIYSMEVVKEIRTTQSFNTLDVEQKQCQSEETFEHCLSTNLLMEIKENCNCVPYELASFTKDTNVSFMNIYVLTPLSQF